MYPHETSTGSQHPPRILIVGVGALGCPAAELLASSSPAALTLADHDLVEATNVQRQILFTDADIGRSKVAAAATALTKRRPGLRIETVEQRVDENNAATLADSHDFVIDACDDPATKLVLNRACIATATPLAYGGVMRTGGQTMTIVPGRSACLACVFPHLGTEPEDGDSCSRMGILAPVAGLIGSLQALAALETTAGRDAGGTMRIYELRGERWRAVKFERLSGCPACDRSDRRGEDARGRRQPTCPT